MPTFFKEVEFKQEADTFDIKDIDSKELELLLEGETINNPQDSIITNPLSYITSGENELRQVVDTFVNVTWPAHTSMQNMRIKNDLENLTPDEAMAYLAKEIKDMKNIVNTFVETVKEKL